MPKYVLVTAAKNEAAFIEDTIISVVSQSVLPIKWVIVSDGSTDDTEKIVTSYCNKFSFISLETLKSNNFRSFGSKAKATMFGYNKIKDMDFDYIGNLDADITFEASYYETLLNRFRQDDKLGISGGVRLDYYKGKYIKVYCANNSVGGPFQMFRKECFQEVGGYKSLKYGGIDAAAEITARHLGWQVKSFEDLKLYHQRLTGSARGKLLNGFITDGKKFYHLGYHPLFFILKMLSNIPRKPFILGYLLNLYGYFVLFIKGEQRSLPENIINYLRSEQIKRLNSFLKFK